MKRITAFAALLFVCLLVNRLGATMSIVKNGSFEYDGDIPDITVESPQYWCDVNIPAGKFGGVVDSFWSTHGYGNGYSLTLSSKWNAILQTDDMAVVSQNVFFEEDVQKISFDLKLSSSVGPWNPNVRSAVVLLDGNDIWDSNDFAPGLNGEYIGQEIDINDLADGEFHTLRLAIRSNITETSKPLIEYQATWDFVKFDTYCGGLGYLPHDFDRDCYVDIYDMQILAAEWLSSQSLQFDLFEDYEDDIDFRDFAVFAAHWSDINCQGPDYCGGCDFDQSGAVDANDLLAFAENWLWYSVLYSDLDGDGSVRFDDFATFAPSWMLTSAWQEYGTDNFSEPPLTLLESDFNDDGVVDYSDIFVMAADWLTAGSCISADLDVSGFVDFYDFAVLAEQWRLKGTLYDWD